MARLKFAWEPRILASVRVHRLPSLPVIRLGCHWKQSKSVSVIVASLLPGHRVVRQPLAASAPQRVALHWTRLTKFLRKRHRHSMHNRQTWKRLAVRFASKALLTAV